ncbi:MAG: 50S ribosomal protein L10 [Bacteroidales bacterium]|jgi:large subunit ribosomal protein L10|nr:50S ribosomal protein L10 [Bacteroidales bacterium]
MRKEEKQQIVDSIAQQIRENNHFYLTDISGMDAEGTSLLRRKCFEKDVELVVVKNTLLKRALEQVEGDYSELYDVLKGSTSVMFTETGNVPAKLIKDFRTKNDKPILKGAYVEESVYTGDDQIEALATIKSKEELLGDIISLLQSPVKNVMSALQSGGNTITGVLKTLSEKE